MVFSFVRNADQSDLEKAIIMVFIDFKCVAIGGSSHCIFKSDG